MFLKNIATDIDYNLLTKTFYDLEIDTLLDKDPYQIAVQCRKESDRASQLYESCGSLIFDWQAYEQNPQGKLPLRKINLKEQDFNQICDLFKGSYIEYVIDTLKNHYPIVRGRFMKMKHKTCLTMHTDKSPRIHIPIYTNNDCMMIIDGQIVRLPFGNAYFVNTKLPHTALNASKDDRVHLVFCIS